MSSTSIADTTVSSIDLFVWASSPRDAMDALAVPEDRCPRYVDVGDALAQRDAGNDGYPGESLYRATIERTARGLRFAIEEVDIAGMFGDEEDAA